MTLTFCVIAAIIIVLVVAAWGLSVLVTNDDMSEV